jgi:Zn-dependent M28 family amino/carboxypeptidase
MYLMNTFFPYVLHEFLSFGYDIYTDPFGKDQNGVNSNIYAVKKGADTMKAPVIVSAHWDTPYEYPGADDNASGCTALLEIASVLSGVKLERNVMFIMFGVEEIGFLGAYAFMKRFKNQPPHILVNLDGIAYTSKESSNYNFAGIPKTNDFILIAGMRQDRDFAMHFCDIIDQFVPDLRYYCLIENEELVNNPLLEHLQSSDHVVFWGEKQHALFITDTGPIRDPFYHTPDDTVGTLDFNFFRNVTAATAAFVYVEATR